MSIRLDPLEGLNPEQRRAAELTSGPLAIHAGAGTGKTRVVTHRVAQAVANQDVEPGHILLLTFTDKAARTLRTRVADLGIPSVAAMTFHAAALRQLRHFWPMMHNAPAPELLPDPWPLIAPLARKLPGGFRFTPTKDVVDAIGWLRNRRVSPDQIEQAAAAESRDLPVPADLLMSVVDNYEATKSRRGVIDFNDVIDLTTTTLRENEAAKRQVHDRYRWFSVDEFQDTNQAQNDLLHEWLGHRRDLCVVGDEDQTIYSFTGADARFLTDFEAEHPGAQVIQLHENYRSTPQILTIANRILTPPGATSIKDRGKLTPTQPDGPAPTFQEHASQEAELAWILGKVRELLTEGTPGSEIAILTRLNADLAPIEAELTRAGIAFQVRGQRFFDRTEIKQARRLLADLSDQLTGSALMDALKQVLIQHVGYVSEDDKLTGQARERQAALDTWLQIADRTTADAPDAAAMNLVEVFDSRAQNEADQSQDGIELATLHRAKGLEWDAVFLPGLEEGRLPVNQAKTSAAVAEERRLFYVGVTRARRHLFVSWSTSRTSGSGTKSRRRSRFLNNLAPRAERRPGSPRAAARSTRGKSGQIRNETHLPDGNPLVDALKSWRRDRSTKDSVPAYVVFNDRTLSAIVEAQPMNEADLLEVAGMGPAKLAKYGAELLPIIAEHR